MNDPLEEESIAREIFYSGTFISIMLFFSLFFFPFSRSSLVVLVAVVVD